jgi:alpha-D-xyloside xylohydrolase
LEVRIYGGRDADFVLYEDAGDGFAYEQGARATISLHWDERRNTLSIGDRSGRFPELKSERTFRIVGVRKGHGIGTTSEVVDRTVKYDGHKVTVKLGG